MVKSPKTLVVSFCAVAILLILAVVLSAGLRDDVSNNGNGIDDAGAALGNIGAELKEQGRILAGVAETVTDGERTVANIERVEREDAELIADCQRILAEIRSRDEAEGGH